MNGLRNEFITFRVTPNEKQALEILATRERRNTSELMREILRAALHSSEKSTGFAYLLNVDIHQQHGE